MIARMLLRMVGQLSADVALLQEKNKEAHAAHITTLRLFRQGLTRVVERLEEGKTEQVIEASKNLISALDRGLENLGDAGDIDLWLKVVEFEQAANGEDDGG